mmetsp:Transcript_25071/g.60311  ORF Transcript_25071/g.60311 Transcript_25071/m.60311 type:complete len:321 (+) Transcript_25071:87-1049(+)
MTKYDKQGLIVTHAAMSAEDGTAEFARLKDKAVGVENKGISTGCKGRLVNCVNVTVYSLDTYVAKYIPGGADVPINYLSLDVEGWDADVLSGGYQGALPRVHYLEFEYNWVGPWKDQSLYEVVEYLDKNVGFTCYWAGFNNTIWRITNCWLNHYDVHSWSNVACVNRNFDEVREVAADMENLFLETIAQGLNVVRDFDNRYRHPEPNKNQRGAVASGVLTAAESGGSIMLKDLTMQYDKEIKAEMEARKIIELLGKDYSLLTLKEKWDALRLDETKRRKAGGMARLKITDVTYIEPVSREMEAIVSTINHTKRKQPRKIT